MIKEKELYISGIHEILKEYSIELVGVTIEGDIEIELEEIR